VKKHQTNGRRPASKETKSESFKSSRGKTMSLKTRFLSFLTLAVAVAAFSTITFAQDDKAVTPAPEKEKAEKPFHRGHKGHFGDKMGGRGFGMRGGGMMRILHHLNLTEAQKAQIKSIMEANKPDQATMDELRTLHTAKRDGTITAEQQARLQSLREQSKIKMQSVHEQVQNVLTAEQKAQLEAKKAEMKQRREEFRQKREQYRQQKQAAPATTTEAPKVN
jgi:Spy/CpxP family protein refolding chaperone